MEVQKLKYEVEVFVPFLCLNLNQGHLLQCLKFWSLTAAKIYIENQVWLSLVDTIWSENNSLVIFKKEICWDHWDSKKALWACAQEKRVIFSSWLLFQTGNMPLENATSITTMENVNQANVSYPHSLSGPFLCSISWRELPSKNKLSSYSVVITDPYCVP